MILVIDNYDSFTWNLVHLIGTSGEEVVVKRNDSLGVTDSLAASPRAIILSPGPCGPDEAGICLGLIPAAKAAGVPLLGVCLGYQAMVQAEGGRIVRAGRLMHGRTSPVRITAPADPLFAGVPSPFTATRYHSLVAAKDCVPPSVEVTAVAEDDGEIMAARIRGTAICGVQFHPESIASEHGATVVTNFLRSAHIPGIAA